MTSPGRATFIPPRVMTTRRDVAAAKLLTFDRPSDRSDDHRCSNNSMAEAPDIAEWCRRYGPMVLRRCRRLLRDESEALDACQDVFVRVIERRQWLKDDYPSRSMRSWDHSGWHLRSPSALPARNRAPGLRRAFPHGRRLRRPSWWPSLSCRQSRGGNPGALQYRHLTMRARPLIASRATLSR